MLHPHPSGGGKQEGPKEAEKDRHTDIRNGR